MPDSSQHAANTYVLNTNYEARQNLDYQHQLLAEASYEQLQKAGLKEGQTVWDIGCGSGAMTEYIARALGSQGKVFAVDVSKEQLEFTQERLSAAGLKNITFIQADIQEANDWPAGQPDIVYSRFVLMHLNDATSALNKMRRLLKSDGVISLQESAFSANRTSDNNPIINDYFTALINLGLSKKVDFDIGKKLPLLCERVGFQKIKDYEVLHHYSAQEAKKLLVSRIDEMNEQFTAASIADAKKIKTWREAMLSFPEDKPEFYFSLPQYHVLAWK